MKLSKRCQYGVRASVRLAQSHGKGYLQSKEIASSESLPAKFLESILLALRSGGILESKVGACGGYRLAHPPSETKIMDILCALHCTETDDEAPEIEPEAVPGVGQHGLDLISDRMYDAIRQAIGDLSLSAVLEEAESRAGISSPDMYYI